MSLLSPVTPENAHLVANLYGNLGGLYHQQGNTELAKQAMEQGISLLEQYQLLYMNDSIVQICNYAALLQIPVKRLVDYPPYANVPGW